MTLFDLPKIKEELDRTNREIEQEDFWNDPDYAQKVMKEKKNMEDTVESYEDLQSTLDDIEELIEMTGDDDQSVAEEIQAMFDDVSKRADDMRVKTLLNGKYDKCGAIVSIHAGTGGVDAMDWASMLLRMYTRWCEKKGKPCRPAGRHRSRHKERYPHSRRGQCLRLSQKRERRSPPCQDLTVQRRRQETDILCPAGGGA